MGISPELLQNCREIKEIMEGAHTKIQRNMLETEARRGGQGMNAIKGGKGGGDGKGGTGHVTKGGDFLPDKSDEKKQSPPKKKEDILLQFENNYGDEYNELLDGDGDEEKREPALSRPFSHVVIANQVESVEE